MVEKQASSEIAESRERLVNAREKWMGDGDTAMRTPFRVRDAFDAGYQAAERDTRERLDQQLKAEIAERKKWQQLAESLYENVNIELAERIRGKE
jgi:hypothetical protein